MGSQAAAELGDHREKQKGKRLLIMCGEAWEVRREASEKVKMKLLKPSSCNSASGHTEEGTHLLAKNLRTWFLGGGLESLFGEPAPPHPPTKGRKREVVEVKCLRVDVKLEVNSNKDAFWLRNSNTL